MPERRIVNQEAEVVGPAAQDKPAYTKKDDSGKEIPWYPAPAGHATSHNQAIAARGQDMFRKGTSGEDPGLPAVLAYRSPADVKWVPIPAGGIMQLAEDLFPGDVRNEEAMHGHVFDLLVLNRDVVRNDTDHPVGALVRVP